MAKQATLTINVNQAQFQGFVKSFNQLSSNFNKFQQQFNQFSATVNRTNLAMRALSTSIHGAGNAMAKISTTATKITRQFISWHTIIGAVTGLLGAGGGMMGIDRLASSILQKRRFVMGLGGDYGRTQAALVSGQGIFGGGTGDILRNIRMGLGGAPDQMKALMMAGVPYGTKEPPEQVMEKMIKYAAHIMQTAPKGAELIYAQGLGLTSVFTPEELFRMMTKEGQEELENRQKWNQQLAEALRISPEAQKAWRDFVLQLAGAAGQMQRIFGEGLAKLSGPLQHLSESFVHLVDVFMKSEALQAIIQKLSKWMDSLATDISNLTEKDINEFMDKLKKWIKELEPVVRVMKWFVDLVTIVCKALTGIVDFIHKFWGPKGMTRGEFEGSPDIPFGNDPKNAAPPGPGDAPPGPAPPDTVPPTTPSPTPAPGPTTTPGPAGPAGGNGAGSPGGAGGPGGMGGAGGRGVAGGVAGLPGGPSGPATRMPHTAGPQNAFDPSQGPIDRGKAFGGFGGNIFPPGRSSGSIMPMPPNIPRAGMPGGPSGEAGKKRQVPFSPDIPFGPGSSDKPTEVNPNWYGALHGLIPKGGQKTQLASFSGESGAGQGARGALNTDNWQMSRTASLVVRDVPGSNVFLSSTAMAG